MAKTNVLIESKKRKAEQLASQRRWNEAEAVYVEICRRAGGDAGAWTQLSEMLKKQGRFAEAETAARKATVLSPNNAEAQYALGSALHCQGKIAESVPHYRAALKTNSDYIDALFLLAKALEYTGQKVEPESLLRRTLALQPDFAPGMSTLSGILITKDEFSEAKALLDRALELHPHSTEALCNYAFWCIQNKDEEKAVHFYERAIASNPGSEEALSGYVSLLEKLNRWTEVQDAAQAALQRHPSHAKLNSAMARIHRRSKRWDEMKRHAEIAVANAPSPSVASPACMLLGQALDELGNSDGAMAAFAEGKRLAYLADHIPDADAMAADYLNAIDRMAATLKPGIAKITVGPHVDGKSPLFLIGFPRSGTTLLEQILDAHPALQTIEELPMAARAGEAFLELTEGRDDPLGSLSNAEIQALRNVYLEELALRVQPRPDAILVDKLPLNTIWTPLLWRIFPETKFILSIRHPFDACLSCFMQDFELNTAMANFTTLDGAVNLYLKVMALWKRAAELLPLKHHRIRYEDLVKDFDGEVGALLSFLNLPWDESIRQHRERSLKKSIDTPSYHQVTQPIYQHAVYRWQRYEKYFAPHADAMGPYLRMFDYEEARLNASEQ